MIVGVSMQHSAVLYTHNVDHTAAKKSMGRDWSQLLTSSKNKQAVTSFKPQVELPEGVPAEESYLIVQSPLFFHHQASSKTGPCGSATTGPRSETAKSGLTMNAR